MKKQQILGLRGATFMIPADDEVKRLKLNRVVDLGSVGIAGKTSKTSKMLTIARTRLWKTKT